MNNQKKSTDKQQNGEKHHSVNPLAKSSNQQPLQPNTTFENVGIYGLEDDSYITKITLTVGKKYIIETLNYILIDYYKEETIKEITDKYSVSLYELLYSMCSDSYLYEMSFTNLFLNNINSYIDEKLINLAQPVNVTDIIPHLVKHIQLSLPHILKDIKNRTVQKFITIEPNYKYEEEKILSDENNNIKDVRFKINPTNFIKYTSIEDSNECTSFVYLSSLLYSMILDQLYNYVQETLNTVPTDS